SLCRHPRDLHSFPTRRSSDLLVCAGVFNLGDGVRLVEKRGQFMQQAVPAGTGAMAAILGLDDDQVRAACAAAAQGNVVEAVNLKDRKSTRLNSSHVKISYAVF